MKKSLALFMVSFFLITSIYAERGVKMKEKRHALVIGNADYQSSPLKNPVNDAIDMADLLKQRGFEVTLLNNATQRQMERAISRFGKKLMTGGVGLFFYAGHGMQVDGVNYLIPISANIEAEDDIKYESVDANRVLSKMESAGNKLNMVFLDACRDNPFARSFRSSTKGLAQMDAPPGSLVVYATSPGSVAADGTGRNGIFTKHLLGNIQKQNIELSQIIKNIGAGVINETSRKQIPWSLSSFTGSFYFNRDEKAVEPVAVASLAPTVPAKTVVDEDDKVMWMMVKESNSVDDVQVYLESYPKGQYVVEAKKKIWELEHNTLDKRIQYIIANPKGEHLATAKGDLRKELIKSEDSKFLQQYPKKYPKAPYQGIAKLRLKQLSKTRKAKRKKYEESVVPFSIEHN